MKKIFLPFLFFQSMVVNTAIAQLGAGFKKPNVIIVLTDDQGYGDFSCHGNPVLKTPYLDKLYNESVRFDNFHVSPLCTPSRGELLTGLDALHNRASNVLTGRGLMRRDIVTLPEIFLENGYRTGIFGKWHLGDTYPDRPMDRGFEKCDWIKGWGLFSEMEFDNDYYRTRYIDSLQPRQSEMYCTDLWFDLAMQWMDGLAKGDKPFFTYLPLNAAHGPFYGPKRNTDEYLNKTPDAQTANFFGMITNIDENMKKLDTWLKDRGLFDNTIVILMNDNGGTAGVKVYNAGMRDQKGSNYDGGHRAACFIRWPAGKLGPARTVHSPSNIQDLIPSLIDLLHLKMRKQQSFDGISLKKFLLNPKEPAKDRMFVVQYTGEKEDADGSVHSQKYDGCVVFNDWRLVGDSALYDLTQDPGQQNNIITQNLAIYRKMHAYYEQWWQKISPGLEHVLPIYIGSPAENPVILNSNNWSGRGVNTQWGVALANGPKNGGVITVYAETTGTYRIELSRWPFHIDRSLNQLGPGKAVGGTPIREGKELSIASGAVVLNGSVPVIVQADPGSHFISIEMSIKKGENKLQAWFRDQNGKDICGAYYIRIEKI